MGQRAKPPGEEASGMKEPESCDECNVHHLVFPPAPSANEPPLNQQELRGLRKVFQTCPMALKALKGMA